MPGRPFRRLARGLLASWRRGNGAAASGLATSTSALNHPVRRNLPARLWNAAPSHHHRPQPATLAPSRATLGASLDARAARDRPCDLRARPPSLRRPLTPIAERTPDPSSCRPSVVEQRRSSASWCSCMSPCLAETPSPRRREGFGRQGLTATRSGDGACGKTSLLNVFTRGYVWSSAPATLCACRVLTILCRRYFPTV